ncbi:2-iminoacetate synthase ThiH [Lentisphaerota bacterium ZTH]|nr:2-iminoacetate synthase ThiH [Lentisphaerota bacterium]WET05172.1 2-iminoacetate synthase ThiH [Lentisphaerota bacterium ZTH]
MFPYLKADENQISDIINNTTSCQVEQVLSSERPDFQGFLSLLSPVAADFLEAMRQKAQVNRLRHFGRTVSFYAPLYISNKCVNSCKYCDFNINHKFDRKDLSLDDIMLEAQALKSQGIDSLLLVAGEDPKGVTIEYLEATAKILKKLFSYISIEVAPLEESDYKRLFAAGIDGVTLYQETYNQPLYADLHPAGPKRDYMYRLSTHLRAGKAGMRNLGMGFLLGLYDWRLEAASLAAHSIYVRKHCWRSKIQYSFPRITPIEDQFEVPLPVNEKELEQLMLAFRITFPESDMTVSTRETAEFRNRIIQTCAANMSAGSKVTPGGYAIEADKDVGQFSLNDNRSVSEVKRDIESLDYEPVSKYWDKLFVCD